mgnify:CR=1 FL=1
MIPIAKVKLIVDTYKTLEKELASGNIDKKDFVKKSKEYSSITEIINEAKFYVNYAKEKEEIEKIINDKSLPHCGDALHSYDRMFQFYGTKSKAIYQFT